MAEINPLRYRGYYYDTETGFYYLQSRYYDPANHRFINADTYASTDSTDAIACNMFAYCNNNPVMHTDSAGTMAVVAVAAASNCWNPVGWILAAVVVVVTIVVIIEAVNETPYYSNVRSDEETAGKSKPMEPEPPDVTYPGDDPTKAPGDDYEWRGKQPVGGDKGAWVNEETGEQWHPDLNHKPPKGPHWDYQDPNGTWWSVFKNGQIQLK